MVHSFQIAPCVTGLAVLLGSPFLVGFAVFNHLEETVQLAVDFGPSNEAGVDHVTVNRERGYAAVTQEFVLAGRARRRTRLAAPVVIEDRSIRLEMARLV